MKNYNYFQKLLFVIAIIFSLYFLTSSEVKAACGATVCAWNGFPSACGGSGQCVSTQQGADCGWGGSTCYCPGVVGCNGGGACTNGSANCSALSQMYQASAASCCSGPQPTPAPTVPGATPTPTPPSCPTQSCGCNPSSGCDVIGNSKCDPPNGNGNAYCCPKRPSSCGGGGGGDRSPIGYHDAYSGPQEQAFCSAAGWAADPDSTGKAVNVRIAVDGTNVITFPANVYRADLQAANVCAGGNCSFNFNLFSGISHDIAHTISVQAQDNENTGTWVNLTNTPKSLTCCTPVSTPATITPSGSQAAPYSIACGVTSQTFTWSRVVGASNYNLKLYDLANGAADLAHHPNIWNCGLPQLPGDQCKYTNNTTPSYTLTGLQAGHAYKLEVQEINTCSNWSGPVGTYFTVLSAVNLTQSPVGNISSGGTATFTASVVPSGAVIDGVAFNSSDTSKITVNPASPTLDSTSPYTTTASGISAGPSNITANAIVNGVNVCNSNTVVANVGNNTTGWWQVNGGDVTAHGNIRSLISTTCSGSCTPIFNLTGSGNTSGMNIFNGTSDYSLGAGGGTGGQAANWNVNSVTDGSNLTYASFKGQLPQDVIAGIHELITDVAHCSNAGGGAGVSCTQKVFNQTGSPVRGYYWYHYDGAVNGDLTINNGGNGSVISGGRKVVVFIENANLILNAPMNLNIPGSDFLMFVVGKRADGTKGNIIISPSVVSFGQTNYAEQGIFFAENQIQTGVGSSFLSLQGSFVGLGGVILQRTLVDNAQSPAERFEYSAPLILAFPPVLSTKKLQWQELAP